MENELKKIKRYYKRYERFLLDKSTIPSDCVVFIEDKKLIYTHGTFFGCTCGSQQETEGEYQFTIVGGADILLTGLLPVKQTIRYLFTKNGEPYVPEHIVYNINSSSGTEISNPQSSGSFDIMIPQRLGRYTVYVTATVGIESITRSVFYDVKESGQTQPDPVDDTYSLIIPKTPKTFTYNGQDHAFSLSYTTKKNNINFAADQIRWVVVQTGGIYDQTINNPGANGTLSINVPSAVGTYTIGITAYWGDDIAISDSMTCTVTEAQVQEDSYSLEIPKTTRTFTNNGQDHTFTFTYTTKKNNLNFAANSIRWSVVQTGGAYESTISNPTASGTITATIPSATGTYTLGVIAYFGDTQISDSFTCNVIDPTPTQPVYSFTITGGGSITSTGNPVSKSITYRFTGDGVVTSFNNLVWYLDGVQAGSSTNPSGTGSISVTIPEAVGTYTVRVVATKGSNTYTKSVTYDVVQSTPVNPIPTNTVLMGLSTSSTVSGLDTSGFISKTTSTLKQSAKFMNQQNGVYFWVIASTNLVPEEGGTDLEVATDKNYFFTVDVTYMGLANGYNYWRTNLAMDAIIVNGEYQEEPFYIR